MKAGIHTDIVFTELAKQMKDKVGGACPAPHPPGVQRGAPLPIDVSTNRATRTGPSCSAAALLAARRSILAFPSPTASKPRPSAQGHVRAFSRAMHGAWRRCPAPHAPRTQVFMLRLVAINMTIVTDPDLSKEIVQVR